MQFPPFSPGTIMRTVRLLVQDAVRLKTITTGDRVHAIYAEAFAMALRAAPGISSGEQ